ncbi:MAG: glycosyltransferase family 4 protein [Spirochaetales bacterium]|uniref:Glycosyltransferase family 4 protein n=1 Tax=Candidatus Thalassospirochaeta sargassi TaxID=3119039 RepID=A0AAJ1MKZ4_9SPIO|nr:glycosyltransferase family 4 protein [Spirochaetales bacterium]
MNEKFRIVFISGKLGDVDGVSLEVEKWIDILAAEGHEIFAISGKFCSNLHTVPQKRRLLIEDISFDSPHQHEYEQMVFPYLNKFQTYISEEKLKAVAEDMNHKSSYIADSIFEFIQTNSIDVVVAQNTNAMPMTLLGGLAVYKLCSEKRIATIFHHHDFWWERSRFVNSAIETILSKTMPPQIPGIEHVVLSTYASHILRSIKRVHPRIIPNCEDFDNPVTLDEYNSDFRKELGFSDDDILVLQPTRIVQRKRIEDSVRFVGKLGMRYPEIRRRLHLIISLYQGDEPDENYIAMIKNLAESYEVPLHFISDRVASIRGNNAGGQKLYTNRDVLANADFVTYLPIWEGFGNALLEAVAAKVPVVTSTYLVYKTDIRIHDFNVIEVVDNYNENNELIIQDEALDKIYDVLNNPEMRTKMIEHNFRIAKENFGYDTLKKCLLQLFDDYSYEILASRKKIQKSREEFSV